MKISEWVKTQVGNIYVWGGQGEVATVEFIRQQEKSAKDAETDIALMEKRLAEGMDPVLCYDCSGLVMRYMLDMGYLKEDKTANGLYELATKISADRLKANDFVFKVAKDGTAKHIGVYVGDGQVVHAKGRKEGVVLESIEKTTWNGYGRIRMEDDIARVELPILKKGDKGQAVRTVQLVLKDRNYSIGSVDGIFGFKTLNCVKLFQAKKNLKVDGIVGKNTWEALIK